VTAVKKTIKVRKNSRYLGTLLADHADDASAGAAEIGPAPAPPHDPAGRFPT